MAAIINTLTEDQIVALRAAGFEAGVAYMPVPRCDQCKFWSRHAAIEATGTCLIACDVRYDDDIAVAHRTLGRDAKMSGFGDGPEVDGGGLMTDAGFGCVEWQRK